MIILILGLALIVLILITILCALRSSIVVQLSRQKSKLFIMN